MPMPLRGAATAVYSSMNIDEHEKLKGGTLSPMRDKNEGVAKTPVTTACPEGSDRINLLRLELESEGDLKKKSDVDAFSYLL